MTDWISPQPECNCDCCGCQFNLNDCIYSWDCTGVTEVRLYRDCSGVWELVAQTGGTGSSGIKAGEEYRAEVDCASGNTHSYNLGVLVSTIAHPECTSDCDPTTPPTGSCQCASDATTRRDVVSADVVITGTGTCTDCGSTVSGNDWSGTYTVDCGDFVIYHKATLIQAACPSRIGDDVYALEELRIDVVSNSFETYAQVLLTARLLVVPAGQPNPCPTVTTSGCSGGLDFNRAVGIKIDRTFIDFKSCFNFQACGNTGTTVRKACVSTLVNDTTFEQFSPFFTTLCDYSTTFSASATFNNV